MARSSSDDEGDGDMGRGIRKLAGTTSGRGAWARRTALIACAAASVVAVAPASVWGAQPTGSLTVSPITGSTESYVVTVANTGKVEISGFEFIAGSPESPSQPKQLVPSSNCSYHGPIVCNVSLQPGASFQLCYQGAELSLFEGLVARLKPTGEIYGIGAGSNFRASPVSACPVAGFTTSSGSTGAGKCKVPKVVGKTQSSAEKAIRKAGCKVGTVKKKHSSHVKKGDVVSQGVGAGKSVATGTKVGLVVSKGK
jgi:hypothetical protein